MKFDTKHIRTVRTLDTMFYWEGDAYLVFFKNHPKAEWMGDSGRGVICICTSVSGGGVEFTRPVHHFVGGIESRSVTLMIKTIEKYDIDIHACYSNLAVLEIIDKVKAEPDKWRGKSEYESNDEESNRESLAYVYKHYRINIGTKSYPLIIDEAGDNNPDVKYVFNVKKLINISPIQIKGTFVTEEVNERIDLKLDDITEDFQTMTLIPNSDPDTQIVFTVKDIIRDYKSLKLSSYVNDDEDDIDEEFELLEEADELLEEEDNDVNTDEQ